MQEINNLIISAIVSAAIALIVLLLREKKLEPDRWRKNAKLQTIEKRLEAYGRLMNLLQAAEQRSKSNPATSSRTDMSHLFAMPNDAIEFNEIFRKHRSVFSSEVVRLYLLTIKEDKLYKLSHPSDDDKNKHLLGLELDTLHSVAEDEFNNLRIEHEKLTGYKIE